MVIDANAAQATANAMETDIDMHCIVERRQQRTSIRISIVFVATRRKV
jgi:hypothetical protein